MNEREFLTAIDCSFPYSDRANAESLITQACELSSNAAFGVAYEPAYPPRSSGASPSLRRELLQLLASRVEHPLAASIFRIAERIVAGSELAVAEALFAMREVAEFPGEHAALSITYFAADDQDGVLDAEYNAIQGNWQGA